MKNDPNISSFENASKIQKRVAQIGFDYPNILGSLKKVIEEVNELEYEIKKNDKKRIIEELGDLIFSCLDVSRKLDLNAEKVLNKANTKFIKRWKIVEDLIAASGKDIKKLNTDDFEYFWQKAKIKT